MPRAVLPATAAAGVGFLLVTVGAAVLLAGEDRIDGLDLMVRAAAAYVIGLPLIGWPLLRLARVRPAWLVAVLAPVVLFLIFTITGALRGDHRALRYGLLAAAAYAASAALVSVTVTSRKPGGSKQSGSS